MLGPLVTNGIIGAYTDLVFAFFIGIGFGAILEQGGFSSGRNITAVFYLRNFAVPKVMFSAMLTAGVGILISHSAGLMDATKIFLPPTYIWPHMVGGLIFGVGMVVSGYCPGTSVVSSAIGRKDAMFALGGMFLGTIIFSEAYPLLKGFKYSGQMGKLSLVEVFSLPVGFVFLLVVIFALGFFWFANLMEKKFGGKEKKSTLGPWNTTTERWLAGVLIVVALIIGIGAMALTPGKADTAIKGISQYQSLAENHNAIEAAELEKLINGKQKIFFLVDVREKSDFEKGSLPGAYNMPASSLTTREGLDRIPEDRQVILYDADGSQAFQLVPLLRYNDKDVMALSGGLLGWAKLKAGDNSAGFKLAAPAAAPPPPPVPKGGKGGKGGFKDEGC